MNIVALEEIVGDYIKYNSSKQNIKCPNTFLGKNVLQGNVKQIESITDVLFNNTHKKYVNDKYTCPNGRIR